MISDQKLIEGCIEGKRKSFNLLYKKYAAVMLGVCMRYCRDSQEAEDILQEGFIKVFSRIDQFRMEGSFEGWIKRVMINTAVNHYHKNLKHANHSDIDKIEDYYVVNDQMNEDVSSTPQGLSRDKLLELIRNLPKGYQMVFNLYAIEGYSHQEIADILDVSVNTSKSQLFKARRYLKNLISTLMPNHQTKQSDEK